MENFKIYAGGEFIRTEQTLNVHNPHNNMLIASTYLAGEKELEKAILKAEQLKEKLKHLPSHTKYTALMHIAHELSTQKKEFAELLAKEAGKPMKYAIGEVDRAIQVFTIAAEESKRIPAEFFSIDWTPAGENKEALVKYFPLGLIAGIAPFNFPLNLSCHKIAPAIATGNAIILKPARSTPLTVLKLAQIIDQTDLPKGMVSIVPMDRQAGNLLVTDPRFEMITFTGSPEVGWKMKAEAGKKRVALELGGNAGLIISESADLNVAVHKCLAGAFAYSGQVCIHTQRIYVHQSVFDSFIEHFSRLTKNLKQGDPLESDTDISVMIDEENAIRVENWINESIENGAKLITGGKRTGNYIEPCILTNTRNEMKVCALEVFGPVVIIEKYEHFDEAINELNNSQYGLQAGVFTNNLEEMNLAFNKIETGGVIINDTPTFRVDHMPYGGIKNSGFGREGVKYAMMEMLEPKLLVKNIV